MAGFAERTTLADFAKRARAGEYGPAVARDTRPGVPARLDPQTGRVLGQIVVSDIKTRIATGVDVRGQRFRPLARPRPRGGNQPLRDTGRLLASFTSRVEADAVVVGTNAPGAALHNFGGLVRAKGKMLALPLTKEAQRSGGPRRFKGALRFRPTRKPRVFLLGTLKGGVFVGQFVLVDQVRIPQREFMGVSDKAVGQIADALSLAPGVTLHL